MRQIPTPHLKRARTILEAAKAEHERQTAAGSSSSAPPPQSVLISSSPDHPLPRPLHDASTANHGLYHAAFPAHPFSRASRIVHVPLSYMFAHLHTLVRSLFGWMKPQHVFRVYTHVTIMGQGKKLTIAEAMGFDGKGYDYRVRKEDGAVTLEMIWHKEGGNLGAATFSFPAWYSLTVGACSASWDVHISLASDNEFCTVDPPIDLPNLVRGQSAPPVKDAFLEAPGEIDRKNKTMYKLFYKPSTFQRLRSG
ncbi:hypothetical protein LshimejAT787_0901950 [Lyophyllum shimeji]|uniref:Uncharacterized protein n=1 Tax=Lyophyllum shimeji TaxID=47721 RepID=A0A9P3PQT0_LYOSH|nr:hypothetical protein LshimejAT787_0901950 [Lyophyllum shimeji]